MKAEEIVCTEFVHSYKYSEIFNGDGDETDATMVSQAFILNGLDKIR